MTKKDYELFASKMFETIKRKAADDCFEFTAREVVVLMGQVFKSDNVLFNYDKFERACYEGKHIRKAIKERAK